jgi:hypothetical protein
MINKCTYYAATWHDGAVAHPFSVKNASKRVRAIDAYICKFDSIISQM